MDMQALFEKMADRWAEAGDIRTKTMAPDNELEALEISDTKMKLRATNSKESVNYTFEVSSMPVLFFGSQDETERVNSLPAKFLPIPDQLVVVTEPNGLTTIISARATSILRLVFGDL